MSTPDMTHAREPSELCANIHVLAIRLRYYEAKLCSALDRGSNPAVNLYEALFNCTVNHIQAREQRLRELGEPLPRAWD